MNVADSDIIADVLYDMEAAQKRGSVSQLVFKKKTFFDPYEDPEDAVERDLLYHQNVHDIITERFPIQNERDAIKLAAYQVHVNYGEYDESKAPSVKANIT